jgi:hypothetical protein
VSRSSKLGIVSLVFFALIFVGLRSDMVAMVCAWFSALFGLLAVRGGSKWWLAVPCTVVVLMTGLLYVGFTAK